MNSGSFTWADAQVGKLRPTLSPLSGSQKSKAVFKPSPEHKANVVPRKRGPMLDPVPTRHDCLNSTGRGSMHNLPTVETKFLEPLLSSKKGIWKPEEKPKRDLSVIRKDPISPTKRVELLLPHERMYYQKSVYKIKKEQAAPLTYQVQNETDCVKYGHRVQTIRRPEAKDMNAYKNGKVPVLSPLRIVQHGKIGAIQGRVVSDNTATGFGRNSYGGFYSHV